MAAKSTLTVKVEVNQPAVNALKNILSRVTELAGLADSRSKGTADSVVLKVGQDVELLVQAIATKGLVSHSEEVLFHADG